MKDKTTVNIDNMAMLPNFHLQRTGSWSSENSLQNALTFTKILHIDISQVLHFPEFLVGNWSRSDPLQKMISSKQIQRLRLDISGNSKLDRI